MEKIIEKAKTLIESLPYIQQYNGKKVVIKYGGSAMVDEKLKKSIVRDIILMKLVGIQPIIVHGGGKDITYWLNKLDIKSEFVQGLRVTDEQTMEVVEMVLSGKVNKSLVQIIHTLGLSAVGLSGKDGGMISVDKKYVNGEDIGYVGNIKQVNTKLIDVLLSQDFIPVIASIGLDDNGDMYNINADVAACEIASAINAEKLVFLTDIEGVMMNPDDKSTLISEMTIEKAKELIENNIIGGGMIPKLKCCIKAVEKNVGQVHIIDGRVEHSLLLEIFTKEGVGTMMIP